MNVEKRGVWETSPPTMLNRVGRDNYLPLFDTFHGSKSSIGALVYGHAVMLTIHLLPTFFLYCVNFTNLHWNFLIVTCHDAIKNFQIVEFGSNILNCNQKKSIYIERVKFYSYSSLSNE